jgi:predicted HicB family RNase H-like nuclease
MAPHQKPDKKVSIRIPADDHRRISMLAIIDGLSLQALTLDLLRDWASGRRLIRPRKGVA